MALEVHTRPNPKWMTWAGYAISTLAVVMLLFSASFKLAQPDSVITEFKRLGYDPEKVVIALGIVELSCAIIYAIPQTAVLGAILLTGYLGGATATHVRISEGFLPPIIGGVLVWLGLYLRDARVRALIPLRITSI
jgi:hypothetical protein